VHSETVDMLFTANRVTWKKCPRDDAFRQIVECTENFAPWTAKRSQWQQLAAHSPMVNQDVRSRSRPTA